MKNKYFARRITSSPIQDWWSVCIRDKKEDSTLLTICNGNKNYSPRTMARKIARLLNEADRKENET